MSDLQLELPDLLGQFVHPLAHPRASAVLVASGRTYVLGVTVTSMQFTTEGSGGPRWTTSKHRR